KISRRYFQPSRPAIHSTVVAIDYSSKYERTALDRGFTPRPRVPTLGVSLSPSLSLRAARVSRENSASGTVSPGPARSLSFRKGFPLTALSDRKSTRLNSSHEWISYAVFCLKKKT